MQMCFDSFSNSSGLETWRDGSPGAQKRLHKGSDNFDNMTVFFCNVREGVLLGAFMCKAQRALLVLGEITACMRLYRRDCSSTAALG